VQKPWYIVSNVENVPSPGLLIYPDRVRKNIERAIEISGDSDRLRPHIKTHKCAPVIRMHLKAGIRKFKCATIAEAEMAAKAGADDLLIAVQLAGPNLARFQQLRREFPHVHFSTIADNTRTAAALNAIGETDHKPVSVFLDIDCGMGRTGIAPGNAALNLYRTLVRQPGIQAAGLHVYDGHVHEPDLAKREQQCLEAFAPVEQFSKKLKKQGLPVPVLVAGGTPTFPIHAKLGHRECSPGTYVFWDFGYQKFGDLDFSLAALLLTRVISKPTPNRLCLDLGHKAVAAENPQPRAQVLDLPDVTPVMHSEEHLVIETPAAKKYNVGDALYCVPRHICPTVALHDLAYPVEKGAATAPWKIEARKRHISI
jgi:D-serine deaminase-like pyridoxal phosphate-dependent protein